MNSLLSIEVLRSSIAIVLFMAEKNRICWFGVDLVDAFLFGMPLSLLRIISLPQDMLSRLELFRKLD